MMKNLIKILMILIILSLGGVSCNDLEEESYSELMATSYDYEANEIYNVIGIVYQNLRNYLRGWDGYECLEEYSGDSYLIPANSTGWDNGGIWKEFHLHNWGTISPQILNVWNWLYKGVVHTNRIINQLESKDVPIPSDESYESLIAEMKVARAFYYWLLIDNYGDVPYVTKTEVGELPSKTARANIYEMIVDDILTSLNNLSTENNIKMYSRFNIWAAKTLLANLYLNAKVYTGKVAWDKCLDECNDIINSDKYSLESNYADCFSAHNENSNETIFAIPFDELNAGFLYISHTLHSASKDKYNLRTTPWGAGGAKAITQFIDTYDPDDSRLDDTWEHGPQFAADGVTPLLCAYDKAGEQLNYTKNLPNGLYTAENEGYRFIKFKPEMGAAYSMNNDVPFFRYAQVLMMKAECLLRNGQTDVAASIVTQVRQRAFKAHSDKATVTGMQLTADSKYNWGYVENYEIVDKGDQTPVEFGGFYDELGYEFAGEGYRRRDMIRFGTFTTKSWLSHKPAESFRTVYPIPQETIDTNPNIIQNPDY